MQDKPGAPAMLATEAGVGLRAPHLQYVLAERPDVAWFEVHSENYYADGGPALKALDRIRADYPLSLHGVGISLGSADRSIARIRKLARLIARTEPAVSGHLRRGAGGAPSRPAAASVYRGSAAHVARARSADVSANLVENVSSYRICGL
jgi:uncharacterized protein (UPF0276 family)